MTVFSMRSTEGDVKINSKVAERDFKYYIFDWDDNILHMPTRIYLEKRMPDGSWVPHTASTAAFAVIRNDPQNYRAPGGDWGRAFADFHDRGQEDESRFLKEARLELERVLAGKSRPGPSFNTFRQTLREGRIFAIVTARGHEPETLRKAVRLFVEMVLTEPEQEELFANLRGYRACYDGLSSFGSNEEELEYYLGLNRYHAVTNPSFKEWMRTAADQFPDAECGKSFAVGDFVDHVVRLIGKSATPEITKPISVGFSDDDPGNVRAIERYIRNELTRKFPGIKFCIYDTSDPSLTNGRKVVVAGQLELDF